MDGSRAVVGHHVVRRLAVVRFGSAGGAAAVGSHGAVAVVSEVAKLPNEKMRRQREDGGLGGGPGFTAGPARSKVVPACKIIFEATLLSVKLGLGSTVVGVGPVGAKDGSEGCVGVVRHLGEPLAVAQESIIAIEVRFRRK